VAVRREVTAAVDINLRSEGETATKFDKCRQLLYRKTTAIRRVTRWSPPAVYFSVLKVFEIFNAERYGQCRRPASINTRYINPEILGSKGFYVLCNEKKSVSSVNVYRSRKYILRMKMFREKPSARAVNSGNWFLLETDSTLLNFMSTYVL